MTVVFFRYLQVTVSKCTNEVTVRMVGYDKVPNAVSFQTTQEHSVEKCAHRCKQNMLCSIIAIQMRGGPGPGQVECRMYRQTDIINNNQTFVNFAGFDTFQVKANLLHFH